MRESYYYNNIVMDVSTIRSINGLHYHYKGSQETERAENDCFGVGWGHR